MTRLLVSVRSAAEAEIALAGGADLIDVKEPLRGALGAAKGNVLRQIATSVAGRVPISAALGELSSQIGDVHAISHAIDQYQYAKVGLAGAATNNRWRLKWRSIFEQLPKSVAPVAVIYADWKSCAAPPPDEVLRECQSLSAAAVLVDTFDKRRGDLFASLSMDELRSLIEAIHDAGCFSVVGGSLTLNLAPSILHLSPSFIAVRGAVCRGGRTGDVDRPQVRAFKERIDAGGPSAVA